MKFARYTFLISGIYGLVVMLPQFFLETNIGQDQPPAITHPEFFYGFIFFFGRRISRMFICVTVAFQFVFLTIASDPIRYRNLMLVSLIEKFPFVITVAVLYIQSRVGWQIVAGGLIDAFWGTMFIVSYLKTRSGQMLS